MKPSISILIITYNRSDDLLALLENIKGQQDVEQYVGEVLVLNNASSESYQPVLDFIQSNLDFPIDYEFSDTNWGVAKGRNRLIKKAKFSDLLVLDDDVVFPKLNAIVQIAGLWDKPQYIKNNTAVITLNIFYFDNNERQMTAFPHKKFDMYKDKDWFLTNHFIGAAHFMKRELFEKTGYYPEDFFYGMEEYDLSYRIISEGYSLAYDNSVKVLHKESPKGRVTNSDRQSMMWINKSKVSWRYLPDKYFYSTAILWSLEYLKKTNFDIINYFKIWKKIIQIPRINPTRKLNKKALDYLKSVHARLMY